MHTDRLYYHDCYLREFTASVASRSEDGLTVYLDRSAFYPTSGGQLHDLGDLNGVGVVNVVDEGEAVAHQLADPISSDTVTGRINWARRFDHMQQHTGQHLLSAVLAELFGLKTVSVHLGTDAATLDIAAASINASQMARAQERANELVFENRPVTISFHDASEDVGLRKASDREGTLRVVTIDGIDRSACGGTHVRATGEIGPVFLRRLEKIRDCVRIEFLCGMRSVRRAAADFESLSKIARTFSSSLDEAPALVAGQAERLQEAEKTWRKLETELAQAKGRELYEATIPDPDGLRRALVEGPLNDALRAQATAFAAGSKAVLLAMSERPAAVLFACSKDAGFSAGDRMKAALATVGGRGGGSATMAQGSVAGVEQLVAVKKILWEG